MPSTCKNFCLTVSQRWVFALIAFIALTIGTALRAILSITIIEMVLPVKGSLMPTNETDSTSSIQISKNVTFASDAGAVQYVWDEYTQGIILSSVYWGYAATQFFYGSLSERFGGKYFLGQSILIPSILTFFTPLVVEWGGSTALIVLRIWMGASGSATYPVASTMISKWTAPSERAKIGGIIFAGSILGPVIGKTLPALIIVYSGMGWPAVFYFFGAAGMIWFPFLVLLCYNDPSEHPFVSDAELTYLQEHADLQNSRLPAAPYRRIVRSKEFWAFVIGLTGCHWASYTMANDLSKYMNSVLKFSIINNGCLSSLPYLCMWFNSILSSCISDQIISRNLMTLTNVRKLLTTVSTIGPAVSIVAASYTGSNKVLAVTTIIIGVTLMGASYPSIFINNLDLSPNYSGTLMAISNGTSSLGGVLTPYIVGVLTPNQTIGEWRLVFWIGFVVAASTNMIFVVYGSGEVQDWNDSNLARDETAVDN